MLTTANIESVLTLVRSDHPSVTEADIAFCILSDSISDKATAYRLAYHKEPPKKIAESAKSKAVAEALRPFGIGMPNEATISREENRDGLLAMLKKLEDPNMVAKLGINDAFNIEKDIRVKLQDKFDMGDSDNATHRVIIVPQKHDIVCPHTNRECTYMPTKEACCKYYHLKEE